MGTKSNGTKDVIFTACESSPELAPLYASPLLMMQRVCNRNTRLVSIAIDREDNEVINRQFLSVCEYAVQHAAGVILWNPLVYITEEAFRDLQTSMDAVTLIPAVYTHGTGKEETRTTRAWTEDGKTHKLRRTCPKDKSASVCDYSVIRITDVSGFYHFFFRSCPWTRQICDTVNAYLLRNKMEAKTVNPYGMYLK